MLWLEWGRLDAQWKGGLFPEAEWKQLHRPKSGGSENEKDYPLHIMAVSSGGNQTPRNMLY